MKPMTPNPGTPINKATAELENILQIQADIKKEKERIIKEIHDNEKNAVVVFIDMVGSTKDKIAHSSEPEKWLGKVNQFYSIVTHYVKALGGRAVKFIGDEVMAVFDGDTMINDSANLITRQQEIECALKDVTGESCYLKIAIDYGPVFFISIPGHDELDILGSTVDRCARIGKHSKASTTLTSLAFMKICPPAYSWELIGEPDLQGIGKTKVFQLGKKTIEIVEMISIELQKYAEMNQQITKIKSDFENAEIEIQQIKGMNYRLQQTIEELGSKANNEDVVKDIESADDVTEKDDAWNSISEDIKKMSAIIEQASSPTRQYARFIFLYYQRVGAEYNRMDAEFDGCIEEKLVHESDGYYMLDEDNLRNKAVIKIADSLESKLSEFENEYRDDESRMRELYSFSLKDPNFWKNQIGISVSSF